MFVINTGFTPDNESASQGPLIVDRKDGLLQTHKHDVDQHKNKLLLIYFFYKKTQQKNDTAFCGTTIMSLKFFFYCELNKIIVITQISQL